MLAYEQDVTITTAPNIFQVTKLAPEQFFHGGAQIHSEMGELKASVFKPYAIKSVSSLASLQQNMNCVKNTRSNSRGMTVRFIHIRLIFAIGRRSDMWRGCVLFAR